MFLLPNFEAQRARAFMSEYQNRLARESFDPLGDNKITCSIGLVTIPAGASLTAAEALDLAAEQKTRAKNAGKARVKARRVSPDFIPPRRAAN